MTIKEKDLEEAVTMICDSWLEDHNFIVEIDQDTEEGQRLNDAWNDWYNDDVLMPVHEAIDEALTNGGYETLDTEDVYDICDSVLEPTTLLIQLMYHSCRTGFSAGFSAGFKACYKAADE